MVTRSTRWTPVAAAGLVVALMLVIAPLARAADPDVPTDTADGWRNVYNYSRCAFAVLHAVTPLDWAAAAFDCVRLFLSEPPTLEVA